MAAALAGWPDAAPPPTYPWRVLLHLVLVTMGTVGMTPPEAVLTQLVIMTLLAAVAEAHHTLTVAVRALDRVEHCRDGGKGMGGGHGTHKHVHAHRHTNTCMGMHVHTHTRTHVHIYTTHTDTHAHQRLLIQIHIWCNQYLYKKNNGTGMFCRSIRQHSFDSRQITEGVLWSSVCKTLILLSVPCHSWGVGRWVMVEGCVCALGHGYVCSWACTVCLLCSDSMRWYETRWPIIPTRRHPMNVLNMLWWLTILHISQAMHEW